MYLCMSRRPQGVSGFFVALAILCGAEHWWPRRCGVAIGRLAVPRSAAPKIAPAIADISEIPMDYSYADIAKMIDHSLLQPALTIEELEAGCRLALAYDVASVCILPYYLPRCAKMLEGSSVRASTTIGFPHGGHTTSVKHAEARQALADGAQGTSPPSAAQTGATCEPTSRRSWMWRTQRSRESR
jgi:hypothetical protein